MPHAFRTIAIAVAGLAFATLGPARAGEIHTDVPAQIKPDAMYLIYLHGGWPESRPLSEPHPKRGPFEYEKILGGLAIGGFEVISELRREKTNPRRYVRTRVLPQIQALLDAGVPPTNITVAGFSKGGGMALLVAAMAKQPQLNIVNMAGCGKGPVRKSYDSFLANDASRMRGRMLSMYDSKDLIAGTCSEAVAKAPNLTFEEVVLEDGGGHGTFYAPRKVWIDKIVAWAESAPGRARTN
ncbi:MAG: hypothetical protein JJ899_07450 [Alphaproteobacteria bacterium]|nr:hypothetical protein [Alphaproteobacteria bacterium]